MKLSLVKSSSNVTLQIPDSIAAIDAVFVAIFAVLAATAAVLSVIKE